MQLKLKLECQKLWNKGLIIRRRSIYKVQLKNASVTSVAFNTKLHSRKTNVPEH